jgi:branched-chain amino acid transport system substrate-binding protein
LRANTTTTMDIEAFKPALLAAAKGEKVGLITENTDAWIESRKSVHALFTAPGQVVFDDKYEVQQNDFTALVTNAKQSGAGLLCIMGTTPEHYSNIIRAAGEIGYHPKIALVPGLIFPEAVAIAGKAMNGAFSADVYVPNIDNAENRAFVAAFQKEYGKKPDKGVELGFESVWVIAKAADKAGTADDTAKIAKTIKATTWNLPRGEIRYDDKGQAHGKYYTITVKDDQIDQWK